MIRRDIDGFVLDQNGDGGDSARSAGIMSLFEMDYKTGYYFDGKGICVRHPTQAPWNNPNNFTRDQLICLVSGMTEYNAKNVFWSHAKRFFFCQNIERDYVGSTKYPFPSHYVDAGGEAHFCWFDYRDPLFIHHIGHLILCARIYCLYWLLLFSYPLLFLSIIFNSKKIDSEQNQQIAICFVAGKFWIKLYKYFNPNWAIQTDYYWNVRRNCKEMSDLIISSLKEI